VCARNAPHAAESGTASVELVATLPLLLAAVLAAAQLAAAGQALWSAALAARAGARAAVVGGDAAAAGRRALPPSLREGARIEDGAGVSVRVAVPRLLPLLPEIEVGAKTGLDGGTER
jgi:hypothetical protein